MVLVIVGSFGDGLKSANSTLTVHLDGHPAYTASAAGISTTSSDTNKLRDELDTRKNLPFGVVA